MRIGLFTDSYRPASNGVVYTVEILRRRLTELGHEVFIFAPAAGFRPGPSDDDHVIRFPAITGLGFSEAQLSLFFPPRLLRRIARLDLDLVTFLSPGQVGLMSAYVARKTDLPLVGQHTTDLCQYARSYRGLTLGSGLLNLMLPFAVHLSSAQRRRLVKTYLPQSGQGGRTGEAIALYLTLLYAACDATIVLSRKSARQLSELAQRWEADLRLRVIPTGVDPLPTAPAAAVRDFRTGLGLTDQDEVVTYVGRLAEEKNLDRLIEMAGPLVRRRPRAHLVLVGDFDYRAKLEAAAALSPAAESIHFAGRLPRLQLSAAYQAADVFVFPSLTDTQGLVLNEAAHTGLPIVLIDTEVSACFEAGGNGLAARDQAFDLARQTARLLGDPALRARMGRRSRQLAAACGELAQTAAMAELYQEVRLDPGTRRAA
ncbi:MAG: glycosyltransferase [Propionibacteriaceae bacterium]|jgi:glycosyltransferase involved in cell wall biosynthesis|nr:glycosyltransferase [Propionibacteriaceae bacterium]